MEESKNTQSTTDEVNESVVVSEDETLIDMPDDIHTTMMKQANLEDNLDGVAGTATIRNYPYKVYSTDETPPEGVGVILLPSHRIRALTKMLIGAGVDLGDVDQMETANITDYQRRLLAYVMDLYTSTDNNYSDRALDREDANWTQGIKNEGVWIAPGRPRGLAKSDPVLKIRTSLGIGGAFTFPLWHTGIWITLKTPAQGKYFNLLRDIYLKKREMGRMSNGMVFSQMNAYTVEEVLDFILDNVYQTTYMSANKEDLLAILDWRDIPWLVMAQAQTIYSNGYEFQQPCIATEGCEHITSGKINLGRTFYTDSNGFTPMQISHMANSNVKRTKEDIDTYKKAFVYKCNRTVRLSDELSVRIGDTTAERFRNSSNTWINEITTSVQSMFAKTMTLEQRQRHVTDMATLDTVRQYAHFFEAIIMHSGDEEEELVITTEAEVDSLVHTIQEDVVATTALYDALSEYWKDSIRAFVGIPVYECPDCGKTPEIPTEPHNNTELIPLEPIRIFFTLLAQHRDSRMATEQYRTS